MNTRNGRKKDTIEDILKLIDEVKILAERRDEEGVRERERELLLLALRGIMTGDFKGQSVKIVAKLALSVRDLCS